MAVSDSSPWRARSSREQRFSEPCVTHVLRIASMLVSARAVESNAARWRIAARDLWHADVSVGSRNCVSPRLIRPSCCVGSQSATKSATTCTTAGSRAVRRCVRPSTSSRRGVSVLCDDLRGVMHGVVLVVAGVNDEDVDIDLQIRGPRTPGCTCIAHPLKVRGLRGERDVLADAKPVCIALPPVALAKGRRDQDRTSNGPALANGRDGHATSSRVCNDCVNRTQRVGDGDDRVGPLETHAPITARCAVARKVERHERAVPPVELVDERRPQ